jgi:hypothetical protein
MAATLVPLRKQQIDNLPIGASVVYRFVYTAIPGPDPATWDTIRFSISDVKSGGTAYFTVLKAAMTATAGGTAGAYTLTLDVPVTEAQSRLVDPGGGIRPYQLDFVSSGGYQDIIEDGTVAVYTPAVVLP